MVEAHIFRSFRLPFCLRRVVSLVMMQLGRAKLPVRAPSIRIPKLRKGCSALRVQQKLRQLTLRPGLIGTLFVLESYWYGFAWLRTVCYVRLMFRSNPLGCSAWAVKELNVLE
jgi:hypothetical protein